MTNPLHLDFSLHPKQGLALQSKATELLYGGAASGGKSHLSRILSILWCLEIPGLQVYFFRRLYDDLVKNHLEGPTGFRYLLASWINIRHPQSPLTGGKLAEVVDGEIRFFNGSRIFLCHCFTGDTLIQTTEGNKRIKDLINTSGLLRVTKSFTTQFENVRLTRKAAAIVTVSFDDGTSYRCTPDHRFLTLDGFIEARDLVGKSCLTNQSQLSVQRLKSLKEKDSVRIHTDIMEVPTTDSIEPYGSIITGLFQKALRFITSMRTKTITTLRISNSKRSVPIENYMPVQNGTKSRQDRPQLKEIKRQENGTLPQRVINGIKSKLSGFKPIKLIRHAIIVGQSLRDLLIQGTDPAQEVADSNYSVKKERLLFKRCSSVRVSGTEDVYCMTVPEVGLFPLANGVLVSNCQHEKDLIKYQGPEFHVLFLEEATQFTERMIRFLRSRLRIPDAIAIPEKYKGLFPRAIYTANPGGIGHSYLKKAFITGFKPFEYYKSPEDDGGYIRQFIPARVDDNPSIDIQRVKESLKGLPPVLVDAMLNGNWDAVVGAYFPEADKKKHLIKPFIIPEYWQRGMAMDWGACGEGDPFAIAWYAVSDGSIPRFPRDSVICYRSFYGKGLPKVTASWVADEIIRREQGEKITDRVAGGDIAEKKGHGESLLEIFSKKGINFRRADMRRVSGWTQFRERLVGKNEVPMAYWFSDQEFEFETTMNLQHDPHDPNDCAPGEDHIADRDRYYFMSRPWVLDKPKKSLTLEEKFTPPTINDIWQYRDNMNNLRGRR